jgi:hypothetical protein
VTYGRPVPLGWLLELLAHRGILPAFEVLVVDNDAEGNAAELFRKFEALPPIRHAAERVRSISHARNRPTRTGRALRRGS